MTTGKEYLAITTKRIIGTTDFSTRFFNYLNDQIYEMNSKNYSSSGWLGFGATIAADGADKIQVTKIDPLSLACDGVGHFLDVNPSYVENTNLYFENASGVIYHVHIKYAAIPTDVQINPVYGQPEYVSWQDQIGVSSQPNSVVDNGGTLTFNVTNVTENSVSNAGRKCLVWMNNPATGAINKSIAIEECTVQWSGGVNQITTTGILGQSTASTTASEYKVALLGPRIQRYSGATIAEHAYVGTVTGAGAGNPPTVFDTSGQIIFSQSWIDIFADGLGQDFYPKTDDAYDIGTITKRWKDGHFSGTVGVQNLIVSGNVETALVPNVDDAYDLGSSIFQWQDGYFDGNLTTDSLTISTTSGEGVGSHFVPKFDNAYDLGNTTYQWRNLYLNGSATIDGLVLSDVGGEGVGSHFVPITDDIYDLGNTTYQWHEIWINATAHIDTLDLSYASGEGCAGDFVPTTDGLYDLGGLSYEWQDLYIDGTAYIDRLNCASGAGGGVVSNLTPDGDDIYDLGAATAQWKNLYIDGVANVDTLNLSIDAGEGCAANFVPTTDGIYNLGGASYEWDDLYIDGTIYTDGFNLQGTTISDFIPYAAAARNLGSATNYWDYVYANNLMYKNSLTTFDTYDDLALIENYQPTNEVVKIEKGGKTYDVNKGDESTIPWPMKGALDPDEGDHFLDLSDSTMFLLGAIKQLYQLHKKETQELREQIKNINQSSVNNERK